MPYKPEQFGASNDPNASFHSGSFSQKRKHHQKENVSNFSSEPPPSCFPGQFPTRQYRPEPHFDPAKLAGGNSKVPARFTAMNPSAAWLFGAATPAVAKAAQPDRLAAGQVEQVPPAAVTASGQPHPATSRSALEVDKYNAFRSFVDKASRPYELEKSTPSSMPSPAGGPQMSSHAMPTTTSIFANTGVKAGGGGLAPEQLGAISSPSTRPPAMNSSMNISPQAKSVMESSKNTGPAAASHTYNMGKNIGENSMDASAITPDPAIESLRFKELAISKTPASDAGPLPSLNPLASFNPLDVMKYLEASDPNKSLPDWFCSSDLTKAENTDKLAEFIKSILVNVTEQRLPKTQEAPGYTTEYSVNDPVTRSNFHLVMRDVLRGFDRRRTGWADLMAKSAVQAYLSGTKVEAFTSILFNGEPSLCFTDDARRYEPYDMAKIKIPLDTIVPRVETTQNAPTRVALKQQTSDNLMVIDGNVNAGNVLGACRCLGGEKASIQGLQNSRWASPEESGNASANEFTAEPDLLRHNNPECSETVKEVVSLPTSREMAPENDYMGPTSSVTSSVTDKLAKVTGERTVDVPINPSTSAVNQSATSIKTGGGLRNSRWNPQNVGTAGLADH